MLSPLQCPFLTHVYTNAKKWVYLCSVTAVVESEALDGRSGSLCRASCCPLSCTWDWDCILAKESPEICRCSSPRPLSAQGLWGLKEDQTFIQREAQIIYNGSLGISLRNMRQNDPKTAQTA